MANEEQVKRLLGGVDEWNAWRVENPDVRIDLTGADLSGASLEYANLESAHLTRANLERANLERANLRSANLFSADLESADLTIANLWLADLSYANLQGSDLNYARLMNTHFVDVDLSKARSVEDCIYHGPSNVDRRTLEKSGKLPEKFLRGVGFSDWEIALHRLYDDGLRRDPGKVTDLMYKFIEKHTGNAIAYQSCFLSHAVKDKEFVTLLHDKLQDSGVRCWYYPKDAVPGRPIFDHKEGEIDKAIRIHDRLLLVCSKNSLKSEPVLKEIDIALEQQDKTGERILFPVAIDNYLFRTWKHARKDEFVKLVVERFDGASEAGDEFDRRLAKVLLGLRKDGVERTGS